jgi:DNA-directed RNA polymerase subunit RPC12/RpoP
MPTVYRVCCDSCERAPEVHGGVAAYVAMDGQKGGAILPDFCTALQLDSGELACLSHPGEHITLREHGFTWTKASVQGRLFRVQFKVCKQCGACFEEPQRYDVAGGCLPGIIIGALVSLLLRFARHRSWGAALAAGFAGMYAVVLLVIVGNWLRWRKANKNMRIHKCAQCGGTELLTLSDAAGKVLPCPHCRSLTMRYTVAGKS